MAVAILIILRDGLCSMGFFLIMLLLEDGGRALLWKSVAKQKYQPYLNAHRFCCHPEHSFYKYSTRGTLFESYEKIIDLTLVCRLQPVTSSTSPTLVATVIVWLSRTTAKIQVNNVELQALINT